MTEKRISDYFVVAGVPDHPRTFESVNHPQQDPITDITVIIRSDGEPVPKGFHCIEKTPTGHTADLNHGSFRSPNIFLCYKRGRDKPPLVDIGVWYEDGKQFVSPECGVIRKTHSGFPANVNNSGTQTYLTFRRSSKLTPYNQLVVSDICIILGNKNESPPHAFCLIEKNLNKGMIGSDVFICYKKSMDRPLYLSFSPVIIDRFPLEDYPQYSLPENLPLFCLPMGASIECWPEKDPTPRPSFSTFILTSNAAEKVYASLINFYERVYHDSLTFEELKQLQFIDENVEEGDTKALELAAKSKALHQIKSICILSHWPFFEQFKHFLFFIHKKFCLSNIPISESLESYIFYFMKSIPFPSPDRPNILVNLNHSSEETIMFSQTFDDFPIPSNGASFRKMLQNLGPENCLHLILFVLTEQKILLHSLRLSVLTEIAEAMVTMIFPFNWNCPYIPMCPMSLAGVLNAPLPLIVGIDSRYFDYFDPPTDVASIDIDTKAIYLSENKRHLNLKMLPKKEVKFLKEALEKNYDLLLNSLQKKQDINYKRKMEKQIETEIQEAFLYFMASILKDFRLYLKPITAAPKVGATDPNSLFDVEGFLRSRDPNYLSFYRAVTKTQMFTKFIEERSLVSDKNVSLAFFDECVEKVERYEKMNRKASKISLIDFDDRTKSSKTVFIAIPDLLEKSEDTYVYPVLGQFNRQIFYKLQSEHSSSRNSFLMETNSNNINHHSQFTDNPDSIGLTSELQTYIFAKRAKHEVRKTLKVAEQSSPYPIEWAKCLLVNAYSIWFAHFPAFSHVLVSSTDAVGLVNKAGQTIKPLSIAYEVLQRMQMMKFSVPDEFCYRILMILCGVHSQPALAVKVFLDMQKYQVRPNAITYGYYNKAVLDGDWPADYKHAKWTRLFHVMRVVLHFRKHIKTLSNSKDSIEQTKFSNEINETSSQIESQDQCDTNISKICTNSVAINQIVNYSEHAGILMNTKLVGNGVVLGENLTTVSIDKQLSNNTRKRYKSSETSSKLSDEEITRIAQDLKNLHNNDSLKQTQLNVNTNLGLSQNELSKETSRESSLKEGSEDDNISETNLFSSRFATPLKDAIVNIDFFSPKSKVGSTLRSSFRMAKNFTKSSKYGFSRSSTLHNVDKSINKFGLLFSKNESDDSFSKTPPKMSRSSTLPQTFKTQESLQSTQPDESILKSTLPNYISSPWTNKIASGKHSEYVYSTFKLAANRINELKSSVSGTNSPVKLNMANVVASSNYFISQLKNITFDEESSLPDRSSEVITNTNDQNECLEDIDKYQDLFDTLTKFYTEPIKSFDTDNGTRTDEIIFSIKLLSCSICRNCESMVYDEEIMSKWFPDDSNLNTECIHCASTFVPSFTIQIKDFRKKEISDDSKQTVEFDPISVPYLSPLVLRKELESLLNSGGYASLTKSKFVDDHPIVYWNLLWYFTRLNLPSHVPGLALSASTLNSSEMIDLNNKFGYDFRNVSIDCLWDCEKFYENTPLHFQWLKLKTIDHSKSSESLINTRNIYLEILDLIQNSNVLKPIQYLISERTKTKINNLKSKTFNSIYRELFFFTLIEMADQLSPDQFDKEYSSAFESLTSKDKESLKEIDKPLSIGAIFCRNLFKQLTILTQN